MFQKLQGKLEDFGSLIGLWALTMTRVKPRKLGEELELTFFRKLEIK